MASGNYNSARPTRSSPEAVDFFQAPVDALLTSLKGKSLDCRHRHDLTRAYIDLADCMKTYATSIDATAPQDSPAIHYLQRHGDAISTCLTRDICYALVPPVPSPSSCLSSHSGGAYMHASRLEDEHIAQAKQVSAICHHAMQVASCIFAFSALGAVSPERGLKDILDRLLDILINKQVHAFNFQKTRALAIWTLSTQQLEATVLQDSYEKVSQAIAAVLKDDISSDRMRIDGLKATYRVLRKHPSLFFLDSVHVFPIVLHHLSSKNPVLRINAACALAGITQAALWSRTAEHMEDDTPALAQARDSLRQCVQEYSETQCEWSRGGCATLRDLIAAALLTPDSPNDCPPDAPWAFSVMGCLTVLAGGAFFSTPPLLKMVVRALEAVRTSECAPLAALHASVWRCFVWAFAHLADAPAPSLSQDPTRSVQADYRERVFATVLQDGRFGVRSALAAVLLEEARREPEGDGVAKSIAVVEELVRRSGVELVLEGVALLRQMTRHAGESVSPGELSPFDVQDVLAPALLDGTLVDVQPDHIAAAIGQLKPFETTSVRPLTRPEVDAHYDKLLTAWRAAIQRALQEGIKCDELLATWKSLLHAKRDLAQTKGDREEARNSVVATISGLVPPTPAKGRGDLARLATVRSLWETARSAFGDDQARLVANALVDPIIKCTERTLKANSIASPAIQDLLADILAHGSPETWDTFRSRSLNSELCLQTWQDTAARWTEVRPRRSWEDTVSFLVFPPRCKYVYKDVVSSWKRVLCSAISSAKEMAVSPDVVIEALAQHIATHPISPVFISLFISHLTLQDSTTVAPTTLRLVNDFLQSYPPQDIYPPLDIIRLLSNLISRCNPANLVPALQALSEGLSVWIGAEETVVPKVDYEEVIVEFYCTMVQRLPETPQDMSEVLRDLEHLLLLPLVNLRSKRGPLALKALCEGVWKATGPGSIIFPETLLLHLAAWYDLTVPRTLHPEFLPEPSQSQSQSEFYQVAQAQEVTGAKAKSTASARPTETPNGQRRLRSERQRHALNDSSKINEPADTCSAALKNQSPPRTISGKDHHRTVLQTLRSLENIGGVEPVPACKKRSSLCDEDDWVPAKRRRAMDTTVQGDMKGEADARGDAASERESTRSCVPFPERSALPSPPSTAEAAVPNCPAMPRQSESRPYDTERCSSPQAEEFLENSDPKRLYAARGHMSSPVQALQQACDAVLADSQLPLKDMIAAHEVTTAMQAALACRLKERMDGKGSSS